MSTPAIISGSPFTVTVQVPAAAVSNLTAVSVRVNDEAGVEVGTVSIDTPGSGVTSFPVPVPATLNAVPDGKPYVLRAVVTTLTTANGTYSDTQTYVVKSVTPLVRMANSFMTLPEASLVRFGLTKADGWDAAGEDARIAALVSAFKNMCALRYRFLVSDQSQSRITDLSGIGYDTVFGRIYQTVNDMTLYGERDMQEWPAVFVEALKRAQLAEANTLLSGDQVNDKRRQGIVSERTGESQMAFRDIPDIVMPVSREALQHLRGYLNNAIMSGRS